MIKALLAASIAMLGLAATAIPASALTYRFMPVAVNGCSGECPLAIIATGQVSLSAAEDLLVKLEPLVRARRPMVGTIMIDSPGGYLLGALKLGIVIRQLKLNVIVASYQGPSQYGTAQCNSACAYVLAGGVKRFVPGGSMVGVHKSYDGGISQRDILGGGSIDARRDPNGADDVLGWYLGRMGVNRELMRIVNATPSSDIRVLTPAELTRFRLATVMSGEGRRGNPRRRETN